MAIVLGPGITVGPGITIGNVTPEVNFITTQNDDPLITENGNNLITEN
jgi:hypothetical protein